MMRVLLDVYGVLDKYIVRRLRELRTVKRLLIGEMVEVRAIVDLIVEAGEVEGENIST